MKVTNRSDSRVVYNLPELNNTRRLFEVGETKELTNKEMDALYQLAGGAELVKDYLLIEDRQWVFKNCGEVPTEYYWNTPEITKCILEDPLDLFAETLDYAPAGVLDVLKRLAWTLPLTDLNKIKAIEDKLGFDVQAAVKIMAVPGAFEQTSKKGQRLRKES